MKKILAVIFLSMGLSCSAQYYNAADNPINDAELLTPWGWPDNIVYLGQFWAFIPCQGYGWVCMWQDPESGTKYWENPLDTYYCYDFSCEDRAREEEEADWTQSIAETDAAIAQRIAEDNAAAKQRATEVVASGRPVQIDYSDGTTEIILPDGTSKTFDNPDGLKVVVPVYADGYKFEGIGLSESAARILDDPSRKITSYAQAEAQAGIDAAFASASASLSAGNASLFSCWVQRDMALGDIKDPLLIETQVGWGDLLLPTGGWLVWSAEMNAWAALGGEGDFMDFTVGLQYGALEEAFSQLRAANQMTGNPLSVYTNSLFLGKIEDLAFDGFDAGAEFLGADMESSKFSYGKGSGTVLVLVVGAFLTDGGSAEESVFIPRGFTDAEQFTQASNELRLALARSGITDAQIGVRGSSVTGFSAKTGQPFSVASDIDFFVESGQLTEGLSTSRNIPGFVHPDKIMDVFPELEEWSSRWTSILGRDITPGAFTPGSLTGTPMPQPFIVLN